MAYLVITLFCLKIFYVVHAQIILTVIPSQNVLVDQLVTFTCTVNTNPVSINFIRRGTVQLCGLRELNGACLDDGNCKSAQSTMCPNATTYIAQMKAKLEWDEESFTCEPVFGGKSNSVQISLSVPVSSVFISPSSVKIDEGQQQSITCNTSYCKPQAAITWYKDGTDITPDSTATAVTSGTLIQTRSILTYTGNRNDTEIYCKAQNVQGTGPVTSQILQLNVQFAPTGSPAIMANPQSLPYNNGTSVTLTCELSGGNPLASLTWQCKGGPLSGSNQSVKGVARSSLTLTMDSSYNGQQCICTARHHLFSSDRRYHFTFSVLFAPTGSLAIMANPQSLPYNSGTSVTLTCELSGGNPLASLTWQCKGQPLSGSNQSSTGVARSSLILTMDSSYNGQQCICTASHPLFSSDKTTDFTFSVYFAPNTQPVITASPQLSNYNSGASLTLTCELSGGNPLASLTWQCKGQPVSGSNRSTTGVAISSLNLTMDSSYNGQQCICTARHHLFSSNRTIDFAFIVYYNNKITSLKFIEGSSTIKEHDRLTLQCTVDGNPDSTIKWKKENNGSLLHKDTGVLVSNFTIQQANCRDTGQYSVTANNGIGKVVENITTIYVRCFPRLDERFQNQSHSKIAVGSNESLHIEVAILSYPIPEEENIVWTFLSSVTGKNRTISDGLEQYHLSTYSGMIELRTTLTKENLTSADFGIYILTIRNEEGRFSSDYEVDSARPPSVPSNFTLNCDINPQAAHLSWVSEFDGGDQQKFVPQYKSDPEKQFTDYSSIVIDKGLRVIHTDVVNVLQGDYWFRIKSSNKYGGTYSEIMKCHVKGSETSSQIGLIAGVTSGLVVIVIISAIIVAVLIFRKGILFGGKSAMNSSRSPLDIDDDKGEGDGLTDNVLYVSAGPRDVEKPAVSGTGDAYSQVNKSQKKNDSNSNNVYAMVDKTKSRSQMEGPVYADVVKPKKGPKTDKGKKDKKDKKKKRQEQRIDVYENSEDIALKDTGMQSKAQEHGYKNQDGLLYVDVQFDNKPNDHQGKPVIHGEEERTDYATVAFEFPQQPEPEVNNAPKNDQSKENNK